jgi:HAD superfamily hydrolase (TIGR01509 family)
MLPGSARENRLGGWGVDLYLFDFDQTLYGYDFRKRLPALAALTGSTQYTIASRWWAAGHENRADAGGYATVDAYLAAWRDAVGVDLTIEAYQHSRAASITRSASAMDSLRHAAGIGTAALLSNNNILFRASLPVLAPDVVEVLGDERLLVSGELGVMKPAAAIFERALARFGAEPSDALFLDDNAANVAGARRLGIEAFLVPSIDGLPDGVAMRRAIDAFAAR